MIFDKDKNIIDQEWLTLKQVGVFLLALLALTIPWTWRVATTHHEFLLLKQKQELEKEFQDKENKLIREIHAKDLELARREYQEGLDNTNRRLDTKTQRNQDKIKNLDND